MQGKNIWWIVGLLLVGTVLVGLIWYEPFTQTQETEVPTSVDITTQGALTLEAPTDTLTVGDTYTLKLRVQADVPVNTYSAAVTFPNDLLEVVGTDDTNSVVDLWVEEPQASNESGTVTLAGGSLLPDGFTGEDNLLTITIEAIAAGVAEIRITDGALFAHDGAGTAVTLAPFSSVRLFIND